MIRALMMLAPLAVFMAQLHISASDSPEQPGQTVEVVAHTATNSTKTPLLVDPNAQRQFSLLLTGNWLGKLEPCGCADKQLGGLERLSSLLQATPADNRLLIDSGYLIDADDRQSQLKLQTFLQSLKHMDYDTIALTPSEIDLLSTTLGLSSEKYPPVISTQPCQPLPDGFQVLTHLEKTLHAGGRKLDCLVMAVADCQVLSTPTDPNATKTPTPIDKINNLLENKGLAPDRPSAGRLVVALLSSPNGPLEAKLTRITAIDVLVKVGYTDEPELCPTPSPRPMVVTTGRLGKYLTRITISIDEQSPAEKLTFGYEPIEDTIARDLAVVRYLNEYQHQMEIEELIESEYTLSREALEQGVHFVGSKACAQSGCHEDIYENWKQFKHAHAMQTLIDAEHQFDPECVACHTVGMRYEGGYRSMQKTPDLADVGCEMCHGPGSAHAEDEHAEYRHIFTDCETCHDPENSPSFDSEREEYFQKINHWTEPRKHWQ